MLLYFDDEFTDLPKLVGFDQMLQSMFPDMDLELPASPPDPDSSETWCVAALQANYERGDFRQLNHYMPLFSRKAMGESVWSTLAEKNLRKLEKLISRQQDSLENGEDSEDEFLESTRDHIIQLKRQLDFTGLVHRVGFHPATVPADGNCALWTLLSLEGGPVARAQMGSMQQVKELREET